MTNSYDDDKIDVDEERMQDSSMYFVLFSALLATVIIASRLLHNYPRIAAVVSEASLVLVLGMVVGFFVHTYVIANRADDSRFYYFNEYKEPETDRVAEYLLSFSPNIFFMALLPPILFNSGYQLRRELFYRHIKPIVMFACLGTTITAISTAVILFFVGKAGLFGSFSPKLMELLTFGSLIAATDTVSVLAVFKAKRVDPHLFYLCFGESALNDAVAIVLFRTFSGFVQNSHHGAGSVLYRFVLLIVDMAFEAIGSPMLGMIFAFGTAYLFKTIDFRRHQTLELSLYLVLLLYVPYVVAECTHLSPIVSIFFSGISARRYVVPNVSKETEEASEQIFEFTAYLAETVIFLELGMSIFGLKNKFQWGFIMWAFVATVVGRAIGIYPLAFYYNRSLREKLPEGTENNPLSGEEKSGLDSNSGSDVNQSTDSASVSSAVSSNSITNEPGSERKRRRRRFKTPQKRQDRKIPTKMMHMIWFAGLRGAVAYACVRDFPDKYQHNDEFIAATVVIVLVSIIGMGGATESMLRLLNIEMNVDEDDYMEDWLKHRQLSGLFHSFGKYYHSSWPYYST